jgi:hypothetical protein
MFRHNNFSHPKLSKGKQQTSTQNLFKPLSQAAHCSTLTIRKQIERIEIMSKFIATSNSDRKSVSFNQESSIIYNPESTEGVLDLSQSGLETINAGGTKSWEIILPACAIHVDVRNSPELRKLVLPKGVKTANISDCPQLGRGLVMQGLLDSLILCDSDAIYAAISKAASATFTDTCDGCGECESCGTV